MQDDRWRHFERVTEPALASAPTSYISEIRDKLVADDIPLAVAFRDTAWIYRWLVGVSQFQGISDHAAGSFATKHGLVDWATITETLTPATSRCPRLRSYWDFDGCGYLKALGTCAEPTHIGTCSLPRHPTRKGMLSVAAHAIYFFLRDVCAGDFVDWLDRRLEDADPGDEHPRRGEILGAAVLEPISEISGLGPKVTSMALADLLLVADPGRKRWVTAGAEMVVIDSLLHAYLHRTGILRRFDAEHTYGPACYRPGGCSDLLRAFAERVDATAFNSSFPKNFPRLIQYAVWRLCSTSELDICNGNRIDDRLPCRNNTCPAFEACDRLPLAPATA